MMMKPVQKPDPYILFIKLKNNMQGENFKISLEATYDDVFENTEEDEEKDKADAKSHRQQRNKIAGKRHISRHRNTVTKSTKGVTKQSATGKRRKNELK